MSLEKQPCLSALGGRSCWVVGCGFLGSCLLAACRTLGMQAIGIDREAPAEVQGDAAQPSVLAAARQRVEPEFIFCCVATRGGDEAAYRAAYIDLPRALQECCPLACLMFCSSSSVYAGQGGALVAEGARCMADSPRARLLLCAEEQVLAQGGRVARLVPLYGEGRCELLRRFVQREPELPGRDERFLNYVHREDAARALLLLAAQGERQLVNVCAQSFTRGEVYAELSRLTGLPRVGGRPSVSRRGEADQRVDATLLRSLGWQPQQLFLPWAAEHWRRMEGTRRA